MASLSAHTVESAALSDKIFYCPSSPTTSIGTTNQTKKHEIYKGKMFLKNRLKKKWKQKYFVLYSDRTLLSWSNEYDFQYEKAPKDSVNLSSTQNIEIVETKRNKRWNKKRKRERPRDRDRDNARSKSPSQSGSWNSLSRKGSMDFGRIFGNKSNRNSKHESDSDDMKRDQFIFKIIQTKKVYSFSMDDEKELKQWIANLEKVVFGNVMHKGYLFELINKAKKERKKKWVKRWFIVYDRRELRYYNDPTKQVSFGLHLLADLKTMSKSEDHKAKKKYGQLLYLIKLQFKKTVLILASLSSKERDLWYHVICDALTTQSKHKNKNKAKTHNGKKTKIKSKNKMKNKNKNKTKHKNNNKEVILPIPTKRAMFSPSARSISKQSVLSVLSTSTMSASRSISRSGYVSQKDDDNTINMNTHPCLRKDIENIQNEILCLKIQNAMIKSKSNVMQQCREEYVEDALLDVDQYLVLDRDWRNWSYLEIVEWITNLEYGRYNKYKTVLFANMKYREMEGIYLTKLEKIDLCTFFGVYNFADCCDLYKQIRKLTKI